MLRVFRECPKDALDIVGRLVPEMIIDDLIKLLPTHSHDYDLTISWMYLAA
jgi:hypothetical protein